MNRIGQAIARILPEAAIFFLALFARLFGLGQQSLWMDEAFSVWLSSHPGSEIWKILETDSHPPLFYLLLHAWLPHASGEASLRLPFALIGALNAVLVYRLGKRVLGEKPALLGGSFWALGFAALFLETQVRMYGLAILFSLLAASALTAEMENPGLPNRISFLMASILALYTHYFTAWLFLAGLCFLFASGKRASATWLGVGTLVLFLPWMPQFFRQVLNGASQKMLFPTERELYLFSGFLGTYDFLQGKLQQILASAVGAVGLVLGMEKVCRTRNPKGLLLFPLLLFPLIFPLAVSLFTSRHILVFRYAVMAAPFFFLLFFHGMLRLPRAAAFPLILTLFLANLAGWALFQTGPGTERQNWKEASRILSAGIHRGDAVLFEQFLSVFPLHYYLPAQFEVRYHVGEFLFEVVPRQGISWIPVRGETPESQLASLSRRSRRQWLVLCQDDLADPAGRIPEWFKRHARLLFQKRLPSLDPANRIDLMLYGREPSGKEAPGRKRGSREGLGSGNRS